MNTPKKLTLGLIVCGALLTTSQRVALGGEATPPPAHPPTGRAEAMLVSITASVEAIDVAKRDVTLKGPRGNTVTFTVDQRVKRLDEVKVGDLVRADYFISIAAELRTPTAEEEKHPLVIIEGAGKAPPGTSPAAGALRHFKVVTTVEEIDTTAQTVTIKGPRGNTVTVRAADPANLAKVHKGDHVLVTYTEALAISLEKTEKKAQE